MAELLKLLGLLTFEEFTAQLIQRFDLGKTKEVTGQVSKAK